jgi:hypothetical protein
MGRCRMSPRFDFLRRIPCSRALVFGLQASRASAYASA